MRRKSYLMMATSSQMSSLMRPLRKSAQSRLSNSCLSLATKSTAVTTNLIKSKMRRPRKISTWKTVAGNPFTSKNLNIRSTIMAASGRSDQSDRGTWARLVKMSQLLRLWIGRKSSTKPNNIFTQKNWQKKYIISMIRNITWNNTKRSIMRRSTRNRLSSSHNHNQNKTNQTNWRKKTKRPGARYPKMSKKRTN